MKFTRTLASVAAAAVAVSSLAVCAFADEPAAPTDEELAYFELLGKVASVSAKLTVTEVTPEGGFAAFYMQNTGGDWGWIACGEGEEADETTKITEPGEYEVAWTCVQDCIVNKKGKSILFNPHALDEDGERVGKDWEVTMPSFGIQVGTEGITEDGQTGKVDAAVSEVAITLTDGTVVNIPDFDVKGDLEGKQETWGMSGNNVQVNMQEAIMANLPEPAPGESEEVPAPEFDEEGLVTEATIEKEGSNVAPVVIDPSFMTESGDKEITHVALNVKVLLPAEGDVAWNDWCGMYVKVTDAAGTRYYGWGGAQVGWDIDVDGDKEADIIGGAEGDQWLGIPDANGWVQLLVPVCGEFEIEVGSLCWRDDDGNDKIDGAAIFEVVSVAAYAGEQELTPVEPEDPDEPTDEPTPGESSGSNLPTGGAVAFAPVALAAAAVVASGIVLKKRSK